MKNVITMINSERKEIGKINMVDGHTIEIDLSVDFAYMEENIKKLGRMISEQESLPIKTARKEGNRVLYMQEYVGKEDERYTNAVVEFINNSKTIVPRIFAVYKNPES